MLYPWRQTCRPASTQSILVVWKNLVDFTATKGSQRRLETKTKERRYIDGTSASSAEASASSIGAC